MEKRTVPLPGDDSGAIRVGACLSGDWVAARAQESSQGAPEWLAHAELSAQQQGWAVSDVPAAQAGCGRDTPKVSTTIRS